MPRIVSPSPDQFDRLRQPLTAGEQTVFEFFDRHLPEAWEIYLQPHMNGLRPDFVLLHPRAGIAVFEVKDYNLDVMEYFYLADQGEPVLWIRNRDGKESPASEKDPVRKVQLYRDELLKLYLPRLGATLAGDHRAAATITAGVIMTACTTARARRLFAPVLNTLTPARRQYLPVGGHDAIDTGNLAWVFPEAGRTKSKFMTEQTAADLRTWLIEPDFVAEQRRPIELVAEQREVAYERTLSGYRRVRGPAGSGKSMLVANRATHLAAEGQDVLVLTFNITLVNYLRDLAKKGMRPGDKLNDRITWIHFHGWCGRVLHECGMGKEYQEFWQQRSSENSDVENDHDAALENDLPALVNQAIDHHLDLVPQYDAILVDEGQDFNMGWWNLLQRVRRPNGEMLLVADETQDLYGRSRRWTDAAMLTAGFRGPWKELRSSHRLPPSIIPHLHEFCRRYMDDANVNLPTIYQAELGLEPLTLLWWQTTPDRLTEATAEAVCQLPMLADETARLTFPEITFLVETHKAGLACAELLATKGIRVAHVFAKDKKSQRFLKLNFRYGEARVRGTTYHSFKGWESRAMVLQIATAGGLAAFARLYVGLTRIRRSQAGSYLAVVCAVPVLEDYGRTWDRYLTYPTGQQPLTRNQLV